MASFSKSESYGQLPTGSDQRYAEACVNKLSPQMGIERITDPGTDPDCSPFAVPIRYWVVMPFPVKSAQKPVQRVNSSPPVYQPCPAREVVQAKMQAAGSLSRPAATPGMAVAQRQAGAVGPPATRNPHLPGNFLAGGIARYAPGTPTGTRTPGAPPVYRPPAMTVLPRAKGILASPTVANAFPRGVRPPAAIQPMSNPPRQAWPPAAPVSMGTHRVNAAPGPSPARPFATGAAPRMPILGTALPPALSRNTASNQLRPVVQPFKTLAGGQIRGIMPVKRPWSGYPYAVLHGAQFPAQEIGVHGDGDSFLTAQGGNVANVVNHPGHGLALRVSDDDNMAIEDTNLDQRQPKAFYATQEVVANSNELLRRGNSRFRLHSGAHSITMLTGWWGTKNLYRVVPRFDNGSPDNAPQNCNSIAARIMGMSPTDLSHEGENEALESAQRIGGISESRWIELFRSDATPEQLMNHVANRYVNRRDESVARSRGTNQYARPEVGDAFGIVTIGHAEPVDGHGTVRVRDIRSNNDRVLNWNYHFGGVVARSGSDRITLENFARGDNRVNNADPRWYFQMYGEKTGQSFHEFYSAKNDYANPVTIMHRNPNRVDPPWWQTAWDILEAMSG
jgi:hypothetical protein